MYFVNKVKEHVGKECEGDELKYKANEDDLQMGSGLSFAMSRDRNEDDRRTCSPKRILSMFVRLETAIVPPPA